MKYKWIDPNKAAKITLVSIFVVTLWAEIYVALQCLENCWVLIRTECEPEQTVYMVEIMMRSISIHHTTAKSVRFHKSVGFLLCQFDQWKRKKTEWKSNGSLPEALFSSIQCENLINLCSFYNRQFSMCMLRKHVSEGIKSNQIYVAIWISKGTKSGSAEAKKESTNVALTTE